MHRGQQTLVRSSHAGLGHRWSVIVRELHALEHHRLLCNAVSLMAAIIVLACTKVKKGATTRSQSEARHPLLCDARRTGRKSTCKHTTREIDDCASCRSIIPAVHGVRCRILRPNTAARSRCHFARQVSLISFSCRRHLCTYLSYSCSLFSIHAGHQNGSRSYSVDRYREAPHHSRVHQPRQQLAET